MPSIQPCDRGLKRRRSSLLPDRATHVPDSKKQRIDSPLGEWVPSERFWDTLPKIKLTQLALVEHNRRIELQDSSLPTIDEANSRQRRSARLQRSRDQDQSSLLLFIALRKPSPDLRRFARSGGPDLTDLRGFEDPTMSARRNRPRQAVDAAEVTTSSKKSGPYDANYELKLNQVGIFLTKERDENGLVILPDNHDEMTKRLNRSRKSLSPSRFTEAHFQNFQEQTEQEVLEPQIMQGSMAVIEGSSMRRHSCLGGQFNNLDTFDPELKAAVPDSYDGVSPMSIDHRVLKDLDKRIVPSTDTSRPAAPNFFLEIKSRKGLAEVAMRQAAYTGAIGARGMTSLQSYPFQTPTYDHKAHSFTSVYQDGQLKIYSTHATPPQDEHDTPKYYMTQLRACTLMDDRESFVKGVTSYRNARELAKEYRDAFVLQANQAAQQMSTNKHNDRSNSTVDTTFMPANGEELETVPDISTATEDLDADRGRKRPRNVMFIEDNDHDRARHQSITAPASISNKAVSSTQTSRMNPPNRPVPRPQHVEVQSPEASTLPNEYY